jgi:hypothetical protein
MCCFARTVAVGAPQLGHLSALLLMSLPQSLQITNCFCTPRIWFDWLFGLAGTARNSAVHFLHFMVPDKIGEYSTNCTVLHAGQLHLTFFFIRGLPMMSAREQDRAP